MSGSVSIRSRPGQIIKGRAPACNSDKWNGDFRLFKGVPHKDCVVVVILRVKNDALPAIIQWMKYTNDFSRRNCKMKR